MKSLHRICLAHEWTDVNSRRQKNMLTEKLGRLPVFSNLCMAVLASLVFATSCASNRNTQIERSLEFEAPPQLDKPSDSREPEERADRQPTYEELIYEEYMRWKGTRHRLGGTGQTGIDCSAFVREVYKKAFDIDLPRTAGEQVKEGKPVTRKDLRSGDLVFFKPPSYVRHVGIFLKGNDFVHASKAEGVTVSQIDPDYWGKYYWTARRILP